MTGPANALDRMPPAARYALLGEAVFLLARNPLHRAYSVQDFEERIVPPLQHDQFRMYRSESGPVAFLTWAFVSNAMHQRLHNERIELGSEDWNAGPHLWYTDFVAPFGHGPMVIEDMLTNVFPTLVGRAQRAKINSNKSFVLQTFYGKQVERNIHRQKNLKDQTA